ncbi:MAG: Asp23/Gls24 family envelope stress response protein [Bacillota bacterium]|nr:Asp23/Gls24 family envelope stress response protein [Bacillota bacterium]
MKVYALIGSSGTGKSHRSALVAYREGIDYIIDDGLLIRGNQVLAGRSAKRENTRMGAAKRAVFIDPEHAGQVKDKIKEVQPDSILLLGISRRMVEYICRKLDIPAPIKFIMIEDIATPEEIAKAMDVRVKENRHVIPLPTFALEKDFPGYLLDPLKAFFLGKSKPFPDHVIEHSIVRPLYSTLGNYFLSENAIEQIAVYVAEQMAGIVKAKKTAIISSKNGMIINLDVILKYGVNNFPQLLENTQKKIKERLEQLTGCQISQINVVARRVVLNRENKDVKQRYIELNPNKDGTSVKPLHRLQDKHDH